MLKTIFQNYDAILKQVEAEVSEVPEALLTSQAPGCPNHALWTLGHLAHSAEAIGGELGLSAWLPGDWAQDFGQGSVPEQDAGRYPALRELQQTLRAAAKRIEERLQVLPQADWDGPLPDVRYRDLFPSLGQASVHILLAHTSFHAGQLSCWKRAVLALEHPG